MRATENKQRIWLAATALLLLFVVAILIIGRKVNNIASQMNKTIVEQSCRNRFNAIAFELNRTAQVGRIACDFVHRSTRPHIAIDSSAMEALLRLDPKIGRISVRKIDENNTQNDTVDFWRLHYNVRSTLDELYHIELDVPLANIHSFVASQPLTARSYITVVDSSCTILLHPDTVRLGKYLSSRREQGIISRTIASGQEQSDSSVSDYLSVDVQSIYYPIEIGNQNLVVIVSMPMLSIGADMRTFQNNTILIGLLTIVALIGLSALLQLRWRREYNLRRKAEGDALKLQLQHIENRINPHFLFNSLNSLYALIERRPTTARKFVLSLSRVYRNMLEVHTDALATLESELEFTQEYFFLQKIRFAEQIEMRVDIEPDCRELKIPALSLQTLLENAIKHNQITPDNPLLITIYTKGRLLVIENNFTPREVSHENSFGLGLERIRTIYKLYSNEQMKVEVDEKMFRCQLPLIG